MSHLRLIKSEITQEEYQNNMFVYETSYTKRMLDRARNTAHEQRKETLKQFAIVFFSTTMGIVIGACLMYIVGKLSN